MSNPSHRELPPLELLVFVVGSASLGAEIAAARLMAPFFGASTIVWANIIGLILAYLSLGYWLGGRLADRRPDPRLLGTMILVAALAIVITPFVGMIPYPGPLRVNPHEIAEVLTVPLAAFRDPARLRVEEREREGERITVYFYYHGTHEIWGATGRIMKDFVDTVFGEPPP